MLCPSLWLLSITVGSVNVFASLGFTIFIILSLCRYDFSEFHYIELDDSSSVGIIAMLIFLLLSLVWMSFSIMLIVGVYQDRCRLMLFWLYFQLVAVGFVILVAVVDALKQLADEKPFSPVFLKFFVVSMICGIIGLCTLPVFKLYKLLRWHPHQSPGHSWRMNDPATSRQSSVINDESTI